MSDEFDAEHYARMENSLRVLTNVRAAFILGAALAQRFPTELDWNNADQHVVVQEALDALSTVVGDINKAQEDEAILDPENMLQISDQHYDRALEALLELAEFLGCPPEDILTVLMNG